MIRTPHEPSIIDQMHNTSLPGHAIALWSLGQEGFLVKWKETTVLFDPYLSNWVFELAGAPWQRAFESPLRPSECLDVDYVVCSHHHEDHMDKLTLQAIGQSAKTRFVVPRAHLGLMKEWGIEESRLIGISHGEKLTLGDGLSLEAHAAKHEEFETDEAGEHFYLSYVASFGDVKMLHAGDTIGFAELEDWLKPQAIDVALLPINGRDYVRQRQGIIGNMNYREAADLGAAIGARLIVPMHYGLFAHNDENPAFFVDYMYKRYPYQSMHLFAPGERFIYMK
ncbi:MBL fold metallo-hydrolase [Paenibacillus sp. LHD-117]|uniref:MBL fold metallo-hydrolase n=1 Tax=Paenibacillus sp. LHD-117 TaxID=3071412 RepID=UPI0027E1AE04|nr:MBL fold metallo-hydrolase [Paenibacillus sp. LHD-117]MDQ6420624.1 MBL fold metallo-hydrolase [Paenibacillus sp. LHD-117]